MSERAIVKPGTILKSNGVHICGIWTIKHITVTDNDLVYDRYDCYQGDPKASIVRVTVDDDKRGTVSIHDIARYADDSIARGSP